MKKIIATLSIIVFTGCLLLSCDSEMTYDDGFDAGYDQGYWDASIEFDGDYSRGYEDGYSEGYWIGSSDNIQIVIEEAEDYARERTGCSPLEALDIIGVYRDPHNPYYSDIVISEEEYTQAVDALFYFYEYLRYNS